MSRSNNKVIQSDVELLISNESFHADSLRGE